MKRRLQIPKNAALQRHGFTVIELLVVLVCLAILMGLVAFAAQKSMQSGRDVKCLANMRQVWLRMQIYLNENQGSFPYAHQAEGYRFWPQDINDAVGTKDVSVYICPSVKKDDLNVALRNLTGGYPYVSYGINFYGISASTATAKKYKPARIVNIPAPSEVLAIIDCDDQFQPYDGWYIAYGSRLRDNWEELSKRHQGRLNTVFCDGHAEVATYERLFTNKLEDNPWAQFRYITPLD